MLTEVLDRWEILVELQRQQASWQQRWGNAQIAFEQSLQAIPPRDAERLRRVLEESLPRTTFAPVAKSAQDPSADSAIKTASPEIPASRANSANSGPQISQESLFNEESGSKMLAPQTSPSSGTDSVVAFDESSRIANDEPEFAGAEVESQQVPLPAEASVEEPTALEVPEVTLDELLNWAAEIVGDGVPENVLFQELRKSKYSGHARQLFEALKERDAFYETDDEVIRVHSLRQVTV